MPYRDHRDVSRADAPPQARWATLNRMGAQLNGEAAAARILVATRRPGNPPVSMTSSRGAWRCSEAGDAHSLAVRTHRGAGKRGAPKPGSRPLSDDDTPQPPHGTASAKASRALSQHLLRLRPSREARRRIAHHNSATPRPPRGRVTRPRGAVDRVSRARGIALTGDLEGRRTPAIQLPPAPKGGAVSRRKIACCAAGARDTRTRRGGAPMPQIVIYRLPAVCEVTGTPGAGDAPD